MDINLNEFQLDEAQADKELTTLIQGFELDLLDGAKDEIDQLKLVLIPAIRRGRLTFSIEDVSITYYLKKPIQFKEENDSFDKLIFTVDNCQLTQMKGMEEKAKKADFVDIIRTFSGAKTPLLSDQIIRKFSHGDYTICGAISTLFLAF